MRLDWSLVLAPMACLALSACGSGSNTNAGKEPTGQVVATVNGQEITLLELRAEIGAAAPTDPEAAKAAQQAALRNIIGRKVLANAARDQGLDKTPEFALQRLRAMDALMVQTLQAKIAAEVPPPTRDEAVRYVADHRDIFAERKVFIVDQIRIPRPIDPDKLREFEPLKTLDEVERLLTRDHIDYLRTTNNVIDAIGTDPNLIERIAKLPAREVWVIPGGAGLIANQIRETRVVPYTGEPAVTYALDFLRRQRIEETTLREFNAFAAKSPNSVMYNKDYQPPPAAENAAPPSTAAPAGTQTPQPAPRPGNRG